MKIVELEQTSVLGGFPMRNEDEHPFSHGEAVFIIAKRDMVEFMEKVMSIMKDVMPQAKHIAFQRYDHLNEVMIELETFTKRYPNMFVFNRDGSPKK